jgi:TonB family protein
VDPAGSEERGLGYAAIRQAAAPGSVGELARALEAHGGGKVSFDVAFDLVLNEVVEQARTACAASGSALALLRDGEMICRATSGLNAPDLGVRVDTSGALAAACLSTGQTQYCQDSETDPRVNAEACRGLGVRSMLMTPITEEGTTLGILEVFSDREDAFTENDSATLLALARRIADHKREVDRHRTTEAAAGAQTPVEAAAQAEEARQEKETSVAENFPAEAESLGGSQVWTGVLSLLVIMASIALGVALGWRGVGKGLRSYLSAPATTSQAPATTSPGPSSGRNSSAENSPSESQPAQTEAETAPSTTSPSPAPSGDLVVTQDGKVIYRMNPAHHAPASSRHEPSDAVLSSRLIHRVEPEYPAEARAKHVQGEVVLDVQVLGEGKVGNIEIVRGDPLLTDAAIQAVRQWRYRPYFMDGQPVDTPTRITIKFVLPTS